MATITQHAPGTFCWPELGTTDQAGAKAFYSALLGWEATDSDMGGGEFYTMLGLKGRNLGAIYTMRKEELSHGAPPHWNSYVSVESADASAAKAKALGGTLLATALLWATFSWQTARGIMLVFVILALLAVLVMGLIDRLMRGLGFLTSRCIVIGTSGGARRAIDLIHRHPHAGLKVLGIVHSGNDPGAVGTLIDGHPVLAECGRLGYHRPI